MKTTLGMLPIHIVCSNISLACPKIASQKAVDEFTARRYLNNLYANVISADHSGGGTSGGGASGGDFNSASGGSVVGSGIDIICNDGEVMRSWECEKVVEMLVDAFPKSVCIPSDNVDWLTPLEFVRKYFPRGVVVRRNSTSNGDTNGENYESESGNGCENGGGGEFETMQDKLISLLKQKRDLHALLDDYQHESEDIMKEEENDNDGGSDDDNASHSNIHTSTDISNNAMNTTISSTSSLISSSSRRNQRPLLYSYLKSKDWHNAQQQAIQYPDEASCWIMDKEYDIESPHLPIHLACSYSDAPHDIIHVLIEAYPDGIRAKGKHGFNPLHLACKKSLSYETIVELIRKCPDAVCQKDEYGRIPLHLACKAHLSFYVVKALIEAYPESCTMKDYNGHTALTYFYAQQCSGNSSNSSSSSHHTTHYDSTLDDEIAVLFERYDGAISTSEELINV